MKTEILMKMTPEGRETVIRLEARLRELDEDLAELRAIDEMLDNPVKGGFLQ